MLTQAKKDFIEFMLGADVLRFGEFKTKSGRLSPSPQTAFPTAPQA